MNQRRAISDDELQSFFQKYEISHPRLLCLSKNQITNLCTNSSCKANALYCEDPTCATCYLPHEICEHVKLEAITKLIHQRASDEREFIMKLYQIEDKMIKNIQNARESQSLNLCLRSLEGRDRKIYEQIYVNRRNYFLDGKVAGDFLTKLKEITLVTKDKEKVLIEEFEADTEKFYEYLKQRKLKIFSDFLGIGQEEPENMRGLLRNSTIVQKNDEESISFILQQLSQPSKLELLYRGSQNGFLSSKFHQLCDNIPNTLTLIRTQFGKTIGGFTPLTWNAVPHLNFAPDQSKKSFLLSLDLKKKMRLKQSQKAIYCHTDKGPCFGGGCDIYIADKCDTNNENYADFPTSYNHKDPFSIGQQSYEAFSGALNGSCFRVVEYEVYRVDWDQKNIKNNESCQIY